MRRAQYSDADAIAMAHRDSIRSIGPSFYPPNVVNDWQQGLARDVYVKAMETGEVFFIATGSLDVYVRGTAARRGIGTALFRLVEAHAIENGATSIDVEASLAGVEFYRSVGFVELGRGETRLMSGRPIACVFMRKGLVTHSDRRSFR